MLVFFSYPMSTSEAKGLLWERDRAVVYLDGCKSHTNIVKSDGHMPLLDFIQTELK